MQDVLTETALRLRLLLFDVDGVMTDGTVLLHADGSESKTFHIRDGTAVVLAHREGLVVGLLSARSSVSTTQRAAQLSIAIVHQGVKDKLETYEDILRDQGLSDDEVAYMGDDLVDLPVLARVGLPAAPADAVPEVLDAAAFVSERPGGRGAVRDLIEAILRARGSWPAIVDSFTDARGR
jgi:3-deoxy-D-manno-octulosonate 8-phosphate phosphatase (KDO 8-P phosphatase)